MSAPLPEGVVIGLAVHAYLATRSKMFCACPNRFWDAEPNTLLCEVCTAQPGAKPRAPNEAALAAREALAGAFARAFGEHDVLLGPTMPFPAFRLGERVADPLAMYAADVLTVSANLAGIPAGSVPIPVQGLPVGLQVMGPRNEDLRVLQAMRLWERIKPGGVGGAA